jgi:hypothetical protein
MLKIQWRWIGGGAESRTMSTLDLFPVYFPKLSQDKNLLLRWGLDLLIPRIPNALISFRQVQTTDTVSKNVPCDRVDVPTLTPNSILPLADLASYPDHEVSRLARRAEASVVLLPASKPCSRAFGAYDSPNSSLRRDTLRQRTSRTTESRGTLFHLIGVVRTKLSSRTCGALCSKQERIRERGEMSLQNQRQRQQQSSSIKD